MGVRIKSRQFIRLTSAGLCLLLQLNEFSAKMLAAN